MRGRSTGERNPSRYGLGQLAVQRLPDRCRGGNTVGRGWRVVRGKALGQTAGSDFEGCVPFDYPSAGFDQLAAATTHVNDDHTLVGTETLRRPKKGQPSFLAAVDDSNPHPCLVFYLADVFGTVGRVANRAGGDG